MMKTVGLGVALAMLLTPSRVDACGGFFCSASPVDQSAERIVFAVDEQTQRTDMIVQISTAPLCMPRTASLNATGWRSG